VLYISGYTENAIAHSGMLAPNLSSSGNDSAGPLGGIQKLVVIHRLQPHMTHAEAYTSAGVKSAPRRTPP
jgi:hypothetical protein